MMLRKIGKAAAQTTKAVVSEVKERQVKKISRRPRIRRTYAGGN